MQNISTKDLAEYLPHRPPMVWLDHIIEYTASGGTGRLRIAADGYYLTNGSFRPASYIELIAQTFAFSQAAYFRNLGHPPDKDIQTLLVAIKNFIVHKEANFTAGDELKIMSHKLRELGPITMLRGEVYKGSELLAEGEIKVFTKKTLH